MPTYELKGRNDMVISTDAQRGGRLGKFKSLHVKSPEVTQNKRNISPHHNKVYYYKLRASITINKGVHKAFLLESETRLSVYFLHSPLI